MQSNKWIILFIIFFSQSCWAMSGKGNFDYLKSMPHGQSFIAFLEAIPDSTLGNSTTGLAQMFYVKESGEASAAAPKDLKQPTTSLKEKRHYKKRTSTKSVKHIPKAEQIRHSQLRTLSLTELMEEHKRNPIFENEQYCCLEEQCTINHIFYYQSYEALRSHPSKVRHALQQQKEIVQCPIQECLTTRTSKTMLFLHWYETHQKE